MLFCSKQSILSVRISIQNLAPGQHRWQAFAYRRSTCLIGLSQAIVQDDDFRVERGIVPKTIKAAKRGKAPFNKDKRRRHHHFLVTVYYADGEKFGRVYTDKDKATRFADRQRRSPVIKSVRVSQVS